LRTKMRGLTALWRGATIPVAAAVGVALLVPAVQRSSAPVNGPAQQAAAGAPGVVVLQRPGDSTAFDATKSFGDAIHSLGLGGGTIRIQIPGVYLISSTLVFDSTLAVRVDCDSGASRAAADHQTIDLIYTGKTGSLISARSSRTFEIGHCNLAYSDPDYTGDLIRLDGVDGKADTSETYLHDNRIGGFRTTKGEAASLIYLNRSDHIVIERNFLIDAKAGILGPSEAIINANLVSIRNNWFNGPFTDVAIRGGGSAWTIAENVFEPKNPKGDCGVLDTTSTGMEALSFRGNWIGDGHTGTCLAARRGPIQGGDISGNEISGGAVGIDLGRSTGVSITGNHFSILQTAIEASSASDVNIAANNFSSIPAADRIHRAAR